MKTFKLKTRKLIRSSVPALLVFCCVSAFSQRQFSGVIADSLSHKALAFATIRTEGASKAVISGINGRFLINLAPATERIEISYISHNTKKIDIGSLHENDTIFLSATIRVIGEVIVRPQADKIRRIINEAVRNKPSHNPEMYDIYQCNIYYKMSADMLPTAVALNDTTRFNTSHKSDTAQRKDSSDHESVILTGNNHILFSETFSKRNYKRPQQLQETVIASRLSGLKKTYFTNLVTDILPFHVYSDYITLNGKDYNNPVSKGWQQRYRFYLADEIDNDSDTTFILSFAPKKGVTFNSLSGLVYINTDGYAISHFIASTGDTSNQRQIKLEQVYTKVSDRWFPKELNYALVYNQYLTPLLKLEVNGHSVVDSVTFVKGPGFKIEKAYSVKLGDSVDLHSEQQWERLRMDSITTKERNTYRVMDSLFEKKKLENVFSGIGKLALGRYPYKKLDIDVTRLIASNDYEKTRFGIGVFTNEKLSKYYSIGGWAGYGVNDRKFKYGMSATAFIKGNKDNWLRIFYSDDYQNAGNIHIHAEVDREGYRTWLLTTPDRVKEYGATGHAQKDYLEIELDARQKKMIALYPNNFIITGKNYSNFNVQEASIGLRYAYGEKRAPAFGYYFPVGTKYPIVYLRAGFGTVTSADYSVQYIRTLGAISFNKHINRWGNENYRFEAGIIHTLNDQPLSRSFLLASKGFRRDGINYYAWGGFLTMRPYDYYADRYVSLLYKHDFDKYLWQFKYSKPFVSLVHNFMYGALTTENKNATAGIHAPVSGYHESGILLNQLLQKDLLHTFYIYLNAGAMYHWTSSPNWKKNHVWVIGVSSGF